jgi:hypothetical protein
MTIQLFLVDDFWQTKLTVSETPSSQVTRLEMLERVGLNWYPVLI